MPMLERGGGTCVQRQSVPLSSHWRNRGTVYFDEHNLMRMHALFNLTLDSL